MKIAIFHNLSPGGAKRVLYEEVKFLSRKHDLDIYEFSYRNEEYFDIKPFAKRVFTYDIDLTRPNPNFTGRLVRDFKYFTLLKFLNKKIAKKINEGNYDFALIHSDDNIGAPYILRYLEVPNLYYDQEMTVGSYIRDNDLPRDLIFYKKYYERLFRRIRRMVEEKNAGYACLYATSSRFLKSYIKKVFKRNAYIIGLGVDTKIFKKSGSTKNYILFIGNEKEKEDYEIVRKAIEKVNQEHDIKLKTFEINDHRTGVRNDRMLAKIYSGAVACICPRRHEGFGLKVIESMACETPVIAINEGGYLETVTNGVNGFLVKRDPELIAKKLEYLINHSVFATKMGETGRAIVTKRWNWEDHGGRLEGLMLANTKRKVILISGQDSGGFGGAEIFMNKLSGQFNLIGYDTYFSVVKGSRYAQFLELEKAEIGKYSIPIRMDIIGGTRGFIKFFVFLPIILPLEWRHLGKFKKAGGKYILLNGFTDKLIITPLAKLKGLKVFWLEHGPYGDILERNLGIPRFLYERAAPMADKVVTMSEYTKRDIVKRNLFCKNKICTIPCGIETSEFDRKSKISRTKFVIGNCSRIEKGKGQDTLIRAIPYLITEGLMGFEVIFAGDGDLRDLNKLIKKLKVRRYVRFLGFVKDIPRLMKTFDVFVFPTTRVMEGFGLVSLEAMAAGTPVIASNFGPVPEVVGEAGLIIEPTPKSIAKAIIKIYKDKNLRSDLTKRGYERIKLFDIGKVAKRYEEEIFNQ